MSGFGDYIAARRKAMKLTQKEVAARIKKEDGAAISDQYLNDVEHERRKAPPDRLLEQIGAVLHIPADILYFLAERMPPDVKRPSLPEERILAAYKAFRREIGPATRKKRS
jgi:transcriptional regulator with XRE-family HTH domain